jgi:hypothetical protein
VLNSLSKRGQNHRNHTFFSLQIPYKSFMHPLWPFIHYCNPLSSTTISYYFYTPMSYILIHNHNHRYYSQYNRILQPLSFISTILSNTIYNIL